MIARLLFVSTNGSSSELLTYSPIWVVLTDYSNFEFYHVKAAKFHSIIGKRKVNCMLARSCNCYGYPRGMSDC